MGRYGRPGAQKVHEPIDEGEVDLADELAGHEASNAA